MTRRRTVGLYLTLKPTKSRPHRKIWELRYVAEDGRRMSETVGEPPQMTRRQAATIQRARQDQLDQDQTPDHELPSMKLAEFLKRDREQTTDLEPRSLDNLLYAGDRLIACLGAARLVRDIGPAHVERFRKELATTRVHGGAFMSPATIDKHCNYLRGCWSRAQERGWLNANPFAPTVRRRRRKASEGRQAEVVVYSPDEVEAMMAAASEWWADFILLAYRSGLRQAELLTLTWADVDLPRFGQACVRVSGKREPFPWQPKTAESHRRVPVYAEAVAMLQRRKLRRPKAFVFLSAAHVRSITQHYEREARLPHKLMCNLGRDFTRIRERAQAMRPDTAGSWRAHTCHHLRASFGTLMAGHVHMNQLKALMGHASLATTMRYYVGIAGVESKMAEAWAAPTTRAGGAS